jgi:branched-chain amino acid transport system substrate-binding protein
MKSQYEGGNSMKEKKISRRSFMKGAGAGLALSTIGFPAIVKSAAKLDEVPIALVIPLTGPTGSFGQNEVRGWEIAVDEINAAGGIKSLGGAKLKGELRDTQGTPRIGMAEVEKVAQDKKIPMMIGCWASAVTYPASQVSEQYGLPHLIDMASQADILRRGYKYVFRMIADSDRMAQRMVAYTVDAGKKTGQVAKRAALVSIDDNFGRSSAASLKLAIKAISNQEIVQEIYVPAKVTNVDVEIAQLKASKPDVAYLTNFLNDAVLVARALHAQKVDALGYVTFSAGYGQPEFTGMVGNLANYLCNISYFDFDLNRPMDKEFDEKLMKRYNVHASNFSASLYSLAYFVKDVLERTGTVDREKVRDAIAASNITSGPALLMPAKFIRFDERGENTGGAPLMSQCLDGKWHTVWPFDWPRQFEPVWPIPKWETRKI